MGPVVSIKTYHNLVTIVICKMKFQTRHLTAMDIWLLLCMLFVALATFEYAILLAIRFGGKYKINTSKKMNSEFKAERKCMQIDRLSLKIFFLAYLLTVGTYFYYLQSKYGQTEEHGHHHGDEEGHDHVEHHEDGHVDHYQDEHDDDHHDDHFDNHNEGDHEDDHSNETQHEYDHEDHHGNETHHEDHHANETLQEDHHEDHESE